MCQLEESCFAFGEKVNRSRMQTDLLLTDLLLERDRESGEQ